MKRLFMIFLLFISSISSYSYEFKIAGCYKWQLYSSCKKILDRRFNDGEESYQSNKKNISYYDITFGDVRYDIAEFHFEQSHLVGASFYMYLEPNEVSKAKTCRDYIYNKYFGRDKYVASHEFTNDDGFKCYELLAKADGPNFYQLKDDDLEAYITVSRDKKRRGEKKLYVGIYYYWKSWIPQNEDF